MPAMGAIQTPLLNEGTAFTEAEPNAVGLDEPLPGPIETFEQQSLRSYKAFRAYETDLGRHINLRRLQDTNEVPFCRRLLDYFPTVGLGVNDDHAGTSVTSMGVADNNNERGVGHLFRRPHPA